MERNNTASPVLPVQSILCLESEDGFVLITDPAPNAPELLLSSSGWVLATVILDPETLTPDQLDEIRTFWAWIAPARHTLSYHDVFRALVSLPSLRALVRRQLNGRDPRSFAARVLFPGVTESTWKRWRRKHDIVDTARQARGRKAHANTSQP